MDSGAEVWQQLCSDQYADLRRHLDTCYRRQRVRRAVVGGICVVAKTFVAGLTAVGSIWTGASHLRR